jgi:hypothetical protein
LVGDPAKLMVTTAAEFDDLAFAALVGHGTGAG